MCVRAFVFVPLFCLCLQDRAHLEGKLEALTAECGLALTQRSELQQQVASSQAKLEHETSSSELAGRREQQLRADLAEVSEQLNQALQQNREVQQAGIAGLFI